MTQKLPGIQYDNVGSRLFAVSKLCAKKEEDSCSRLQLTSESECSSGGRHTTAHRQTSERRGLVKIKKLTEHKSDPKCKTRAHR
jgi:hypothetical protein